MSERARKGCTVSYGRDNDCYALAERGASVCFVYRLLFEAIFSEHRIIRLEKKRTKMCIWDMKGMEWNNSNY